MDPACFVLAAQASRGGRGGVGKVLQAHFGLLILMNHHRRTAAFSKIAEVSKCEKIAEVTNNDFSVPQSSSLNLEKHFRDVGHWR